MKKNYQSVPLAKIITTGETQARIELSEETAGEYALALQSGAELPPPVVFFDGAHYWPGDGHHTLRAHEIAGLKQAVVSIRHGTKRDAILFAVGANVTHGLRRTNADKRNAVTILLDDPEWSKWSNRRIADACAVDEGVVRRIKRERSAVKPQSNETAEVSDLPAAQLAAFQAMPEQEQKRLVESVKFDDRFGDAWDEMGSLLDKLRNLEIDSRLDRLRRLHKPMKDVAKKADAILKEYEAAIGKAGAMLTRYDNLLKSSTAWKSYQAAS